MEVIDLPAVIAMAQSSYPSDQLDDLRIMDYRVNYASHLCYVCFHMHTNQLAGFVMGTGAPDDTMRISPDMRQNHYHGNVLCIHNVVIAEQFRHKGYGTFLVKSYLNKIRDNTEMKKAFLLCDQNLVPFYQSLGFQQIGQSDITIAKKTLIEMTLTL